MTTKVAPSEFLYSRIIPWLFLVFTMLTPHSGRTQGALTNGAIHTGSIASSDETDSWTIVAGQGDRIVVQIAEISGGAGFTPKIELVAPDGTSLGASSGGVAARLDLQAPINGMFTVAVTDANHTGAGSYRLELAQVPGAFTVAAGDEGGALTNGANHQAVLEVGDMDLWTFTAVSGDRIIVQIGETSGGAGFTPMIELFAPNGARLGGNSGGVTARLDSQAAVGGTYTVLVSDFNPNGVGSYRLRLAQVPATLVVPAGDEGGALTNGANQQGTIDVGDLDMWTFTAAKGDRIVLQVGELSGASGFTPMMEVLGPDGARLGNDSDSLVARLDLQADLSGAYTVLISDLSGSGTGSYELHLAQLPGELVVPTGDEGGGLLDGVDTDGSIVLGDLDLWTFGASAGDRITLQVTELTGGAGFTPMIECFAPSGERKQLARNASVATLEIAIEDGGTYAVLVSDATQTGAGSYRLNLARGVIAPPGTNVLANGGTHLGSISAAGESNTWTFTASAGESIVIRAGETATTGFLPWLRLSGPTGALLASDFNAAAAEVSVRATNSGTFAVSIADGSAGRNQTGSYRLSLAKTGSALAISPSDEGGPLTNGASHLATIETGDVDAWTFTANAGESILIWVGEVTADDSLRPWLRLYGPDGVFLAEDFNAVAIEVTVRATNSGTFTVIVGDGNAGRAGTGDYRLSLAKTGSPLAISSADEGGALVNGTTYTATVDTGDVDAWTFIANEGESIVVRAGETSMATLRPWLRLYGPNGVLLSEDFNVAAAEVTARVTNSGTFMVIVGDGNVGRGGTGNYRLSLAKTGSAFVISPSDEGGDLINGTTYLATLDTGDIDAWTFPANAGENIIVRMGETAADGLLPWLRLYGPNGVLLSEDFNAAAAEVTARVTNSGTFMVIVGDGNVGRGGTGNYRLSLAKTGSPLVISPLDEGGDLINGTTYLAAIDTGDVDAWTFTANAGESIVVRMGETATGGLLPWLRLYGPNGVLLSADFNAAAAEVTARATNSGTFQVVAGDGNVGLGGNGNYRLTLARTGEPLVISPGDEGGGMTASDTYDGAVDVGDVDAWIFTACVGDTISLRVDELVTNSSLTPWIRLYGRDGVLLNSSFGAANAEIIRAAPANGTYLVVIGDGNAGIGGAGTYRLTTQGLYAGIKMCLPLRFGPALGFQGAGGSPNSSFVVVTATNITTPALLWTPILTNNFGVFGEFSFTNAINLDLPEQYFRLRAP